MVSRAYIETTVEFVRTHYPNDVALVALMDALVTAARDADALAMRGVELAVGEHRVPHNEIAHMVRVAEAQAKVEALTGAARVALERLAPKA